MTDSADLLAIALSALGTAVCELETLCEIEPPTPDALTDALRRGEVAESVLRRVLKAAPVDRRRRLAAMCREEREAHKHRFPDDHLEPFRRGGGRVLL